MSFDSTFSFSVCISDAPNRIFFRAPMVDTPICKRSCSVRQGKREITAPARSKQSAYFSNPLSASHSSNDVMSLFAIGVESSG